MKLGFWKGWGKPFSPQVGSVGGQGGGDTTAPTVTITSTETSPTAASPIPIAFALSEISIDFALADITVSGGSAGNFAGSGAAYTCDVTPDGNAPVTVQVLADAFTDVAGNGNTASDVFSIGVQVTLTYQPDAATGLDAYLNIAQPTFNYGVSTVFYSGNGPSDKARSLLKFSQIPTPAAVPTVVSATLTLVCIDVASTTSRNVDVHRALTAWFEGVKNGAAPDISQDGSTWNLANANGSVAWGGEAGGGAVVDYVALATATTAVAGTGTYTWDVAADVQDWMDGSATNRGWFIKHTIESITTYKGFASSDNATAGNRPKLVIVVNF